MNCRPGDADFEAASQGAGLVRLDTPARGIDHVFAVDNARFRFTVIETRPIDETVAIGSRDVSLSDHIGYVTRVRIEQL